MLHPRRPPAFRYAAAALGMFGALLLPGCTSPTDTGRPRGAVDVTIEFCLGSGPDWLAYRNEGRDWVAVPASIFQSRYQFPATPKVQIAYTHAVALAAYSQITVLNLSATEASQLRCPEGGGEGRPRSGDKPLSGSVKMNHETDNVRVLMGGAVSYVQPGATTYAMSVVNGPLDLVAIRRPSAAGALSTPLLIVRHGVDLPAGSTIPLLDFTSAEAVPLGGGAITVAGASAGAGTLTTTVTYLTARGTSFGAGLFATTNPVVKVAAVPDVVLASGDVQRVSVRYASGADAFSLVYFTGGVHDTTVTLGPAASRPVVDVVSLSPVLPRARVASQTAYPTLAQAVFQQTNGSTLRVMRVVTTKAFLGGTPATWELTAPDLSQVAGYETSWRFVPDVAISVAVQAWDARPALYLGSGTPIVGETMRAASTSTSFTF